jgi:hypothetical protein
MLSRGKTSLPLRHKKIRTGRFGDSLKEIPFRPVLTGVHLKTRKPKPFCF